MSGVRVSQGARLLFQISKSRFDPQKSFIIGSNPAGREGMETVKDFLKAKILSVVKQGKPEISGSAKAWKAGARDKKEVGLQNQMSGVRVSQGASVKIQTWKSFKFYPN